MKRRVVILTEIISPYRIPLFNTLARDMAVELHVIFLAETDPQLRQWHVHKEQIAFSYQVLASWRKRIGHCNLLLNRGLAPALAAAKPDVIICGGYNYIASWQALLWTRIHNVPFLLWSESNQQDLRGGHALVEFFKAEFLQRCSGFLVPGVSARDYLHAHKIKSEIIFIAPNAVDNDFFAGAAGVARQNAIQIRKDLNLPDRYLLFAGRLVPAKGVFDLLSAYARLDSSARQSVGLVFVGDGVARRALEAQAGAISPGMIRFCGFVQQEHLATYYALAEMLILPTYTDTWGLVVNEAMACGLPVILSRAAGCARDLISDDGHGLLMDPGDVERLASAMQGFIMQPELGAAAGARNLEHISRYSPVHWSAGIVQAVNRLGGVRG
jgi:glycosyltransferase involved in cell wall biosynthesis